MPPTTSLVARAPVWPSNVAILATIIGASVGGGTLLLIIALAIVYKRKRRQEERQKQERRDMVVYGTAAGMASTASISSPPRTPRSARSTTGRGTSSTRKDQPRPNISLPLYVDPNTSWSRQPPRRSASLHSQRSQRSVRSLQSAQSLRAPIPTSSLNRSASSLRIPLPTSPRDTRPALMKQKSLPRLPSQRTRPRVNAGLLPIEKVPRPRMLRDSVPESIETMSVWED